MLAETVQMVPDCHRRLVAARADLEKMIAELGETKAKTWQEGLKNIDGRWRPDPVSKKEDDNHA